MADARDGVETVVETAELQTVCHCGGSCGLAGNDSASQGGTLDHAVTEELHAANQIAEVGRVAQRLGLG